MRRNRTIQGLHMGCGESLQPSRAQGVVAPADDHKAPKGAPRKETTRGKHHEGQR